MGQKCHPYGFRVVHTKNWHSKWFSKREYASLLHEDLKLRRELKVQLHSLNAMVSKIRPPLRLKSAQIPHINRKIDDVRIGCGGLQPCTIGHPNA